MIDRWRERFPIATVVMIGLAVQVGACGGHSATTGDGPEDAELAWPAWLAELPERAVEATAGEAVWAVVPERGSESAELATFRFEAASGTTAVLVDGLGNRYPEVPGGLVYPRSAWPSGELAAGAPALGHRWDAGPVVGRVVPLESGAFELAYDWNGVTTRAEMDGMVPLSASGEGHILRWVAFRSPAADAAWYKGLCFAESGGQLWIRDDSGHARIVAKGEAKVLSDLGEVDFAPGAEVAAYSWGHGFRPGRVVESLEPGLRYVVELADGEARPFFFADLTTVLE